MLIVRLLSLSLLAGLCACGGKESAASGDAAATDDAAPVARQAAVQDSTSMPDVVKVAVRSPDHTTLVTALKAAGLVDPLANPGPFTVFAPVNAAFDKLPKGTVAELLKPENKQKLVDILQHHVTTSARDLDSFAEGDEVSMVSAGSELFTRKDGAAYIGAAKIIASVRASNGWVHVIDAVLVPSAK